MDIVLPRDVRDLKIQIGTDILVTGMRQLGAHGQIDMALIRADDEHHIEAAEKWREEFQEEFRQLGLVAERALRELPSTDNALMSVLSDLQSNYPEVQEFLLQHHIQYVSKLVFGMASHIHGMEQILESLSAYGRGE